jgi:hypothetical protein
VTVPGSETATFARQRFAERDDEVLSHSERSRVFRRFLPGGSIVCKQSLGPDAARRVRHETVMLERLASVPGVVKLSAATTSASHLQRCCAAKD